MLFCCIRDASLILGYGKTGLLTHLVGLFDFVALGIPGDIEKLAATGSMNPKFVVQTAWVIAEVEVKGVQTIESVESVFDDIWAWVELYEYENEEWRLVGNVSNRRP